MLHELRHFQNPDEVPWRKSTTFIVGRQIAQTAVDKREVLRTYSPDDVMVAWNGAWKTDIFAMDQAAWKAACEELGVGQ